MLSLIALFCLLSTIVLAQLNDHVMVDMFRPRALSVEDENARIANFWTPERLQAAKEANVVLPNVASRSSPINLNLTTGPQTSFDGSLPSTNGTSSRAISYNGRQIYTTGRVFWRSGLYQYSCSAAVISSVTGDLISTAGHCVYDTTSKSWYNNNNWVFVPAYSAGNTPFGVWPARRMIALNSWVASADYNGDVAFVALSTVNGQHVQAVVGSQGIGFNYPRLAFMYSFGYPVNINSGLYLQQCAGLAQRSQWTQDNFIGQGLPCSMGGGCSGGPWLQNVVDATGIGYVTSVNSFTINNVPNVMNGPYFESNIASMYDTAKTM